MLKDLFLLILHDQEYDYNFNHNIKNPYQSNENNENFVFLKKKYLFMDQ